MGKKNHAKAQKKKLTKKEKKQQNHLKLVQGGKGSGKSEGQGQEWNPNNDQYKKSA